MGRLVLPTQHAVPQDHRVIIAKIAPANAIQTSAANRSTTSPTGRRLFVDGGTISPAGDLYGLSSMPVIIPDGAAAQSSESSFSRRVLIWLRPVSAMPLPPGSKTRRRPAVHLAVQLGTQCGNAFPRLPNGELALQDHRLQVVVNSLSLVEQLFCIGQGALRFVQGFRCGLE